MLNALFKDNIDAIIDDTLVSWFHLTKNINIMKLHL